MARVLFLIAMCVLPAAVLAIRPNKVMDKNVLVVQGRVYCDTCVAGFETSATTYMPDATVKVVCRDKNMNEVYTAFGKTDKDGYYNIFVHEDHKDETCDAYLEKSSQPECPKKSAGREQARVILTSFNGIASQNRYANNMGFEKLEPDVGCAQVMMQYQLTDEDL